MLASAQSADAKIVAVAEIVSPVIGATEGYFVGVSRSGVAYEIVSIHGFGADLFYAEIVFMDELFAQRDLPFFHGHAFRAAVVGDFLFFLFFSRFFSGGGRCCRGHAVFVLGGEIMGLG